MRHPVSRRLVLKGTAGAALTAPFLGSLQRSARADAPPTPRRLVIFHTSNGCLTNRWFPTVEDGPIDAAALAGTTLEPLSPLAGKLLFPRGLAMYPYGTINGYFDPGDQSTGSKLTAAPIAPDGEHWAQGRSLDHVLAEAINPDGRAPLVLSVGNVFHNVKSVLSYAGPDQPVDPVVNPTTLYGSLTGLFQGASPSEADYRIAKGQSIIDAVKDDLTTLQRYDMSQRDRRKLDAWLELLRASEQGMTDVACSADAAAQLGIDGDTVAASSATDLTTAFTLGGDMMMKLMALSMMCDANRSLLFYWPAFVTFKWDGIVHDFDHAGLAHRTGNASVSGQCVDGVLGMLREIDEWYAGRYAQLVSLLESVPEGDGSLLDSSAVMWLPQYADGLAMNVNNLPIVIAGSAGGYLRQGVSVNLEGARLGTGDSEAACSTPGDDVSFTTGSSTGHVPLNKLYVTLLNAMGATKDGAPVSEFGQVDSNDVEAGITDPGELSALVDVSNL